MSFLSKCKQTADVFSNKYLKLSTSTYFEGETLRKAPITIVAYVISYFFMHSLHMFLETSGLNKLLADGAIDIFGRDDELLMNESDMSVHVGKM